MKQRAVALIADYLDKRPKGRVTRVKCIGEDDYVMAIEDRRDGRTHLLRSSRDLDAWLQSFREGRCLQPAFGICGRCDRIHADRDCEGELLAHCVPCYVDIIEILARPRGIRAQTESVCARETKADHDFCTTALSGVRRGSHRPQEMGAHATQTGAPMNAEPSRRG